MTSRIILTICAFFLFSFIGNIINVTSTVATGHIASAQFDNSNASYFAVMETFSLFSSFNSIALLGLLIAIVVIWFNYVKQTVVALTAMLALTIVVSNHDRAWAFADTVDKTEVYTILPNESAFWVPDVGANKDTQGQFDSESYLQDRKIAAKRFVIPHTKLSGSGGTSWLSGWDYYVPSGRLIIVDRTPYSREWVGSSDRGTSRFNQSFPCQSSEGVNITTGISIGVSVSEADSAKFLYRFGVTPPKGPRNDPQVIFNSVYYGRSLAEVMDDVGRKKVQTLVCNEITGRTVDKANSDAVIMMDNIQKKAREYFSSVGITLDFIGWADTFEFDHDIQKAINDRYAAAKLQEVLPVLQALAQLKVQEGMGKGLETKGLPIVVSPGMIEGLMNLMPKSPIK